MFFKACNGWIMKNSTVERTRCPNCGNTTDHVVYVHPYGPAVGFIFLSKPLLSMKQYFLACPVCSHLTKQLTKEQAQSLRI
jgi:hypothetical protein